MKLSLLVVQGDSRDMDFRGFVDDPDDGAELITFDANVGFLQSDLGADELTNKLRPSVGSSLFLITEITRSDYSGRSSESFWRFVEQRESCRAEALSPAA